MPSSLSTFSLLSLSSIFHLLFCFSHPTFQTDVSQSHRKRTKDSPDQDPLMPDVRVSSAALRMPPSAPCTSPSWTSLLGKSPVVPYTAKQESSTGCLGIREIRYFLNTFNSIFFFLPTEAFQGCSLSIFPMCPNELFIRKPEKLTRIRILN